LEETSQNLEEKMVSLVIEQVKIAHRGVTERMGHVEGKIDEMKVESSEVKVLL
jgi:hypothetical protein